MVNYIKKKLKIKAYQGTLEKLYLRKKFDLISFWMSEHVIDLNKTLVICKKLKKRMVFYC